jgi:hypothetical protein
MTARTSALLSDDDRKLLRETRQLLDGVLETLDILSNPREVRGIRQALKEVREGKVRPWEQFAEELKRTPKR